MKMVATINIKYIKLLMVITLWGKVMEMGGGEKPSSFCIHILLEIFFPSY
jgi:hypothetical protein